MQNQGKKIQQSSASFPIMNTLIFFFEITNVNFLEGLGGCHCSASAQSARGPVSWPFLQP